MYFYQRLKDLREDNNLTQKDVAEITNDSQQNYQLYESGKRQIPFSKVIIHAKHYDILFCRAYE